MSFEPLPSDAAGGFLIRGLGSEECPVWVNKGLIGHRGVEGPWTRPQRSTIFQRGRFGTAGFRKNVPLMFMVDARPGRALYPNAAAGRPQARDA